jgi:2-phosphosulfolactate phosphatase
MNTVLIDRFAESAARYRNGFAVVAIDVVRATTTAITAAATGRRCFPVPTVEKAFETAGKLENPLLVGEQRGEIPPGFHINNSPSLLHSRTDIERPAVLLSSSGTRLCEEAALCGAAFLACLRNYAATAQYLATRFSSIAVIGAGNYGEFREEDQMCCAWLADCLMDLGYAAGDSSTVDLVRAWRNQPADAWVANKSANYLKASGQVYDLDFILAHVGDLSVPCALIDGEVIVAAEASLTSAALQAEEAGIRDVR